MKSETLSAIDGIEIYPIISLIIFVVFFIGLGVYVVKQDKKFIDDMKNMPIDKK